MIKPWLVKIGEGGPIKHIAIVYAESEEHAKKIVEQDWAGNLILSITDLTVNQTEGIIFIN
jgi:hypothetical protein